MSLQIPGIDLLSKTLPCALCGKSDKDRCLSHILPAFVFKHAQLRTPTGYMRNTITPNRRVQDGPKDYVLCPDCEQMFSSWEASFARVFKTHNASRRDTVSYTWADALCALSMVWRVLNNARSHPELNHLTFGSDLSRTDACFEAWGQALRAGTNPGQFRIYWLFLSDIVGGVDLPANINRYIFHGSDFDLMANSRTSFAYVHLPGLMIFGMCEPHDDREWRDLRVGFSGGRYFLSDKTIPGVIGDIIRQKAKTSLDAQASISRAQQDKITESALSDPAALLKSPIARSAFCDFQLEDGD